MYVSQRCSCMSKRVVLEELLEDVLIAYSSYTTRFGYFSSIPYNDFIADI